MNSTKTIARKHSASGLSIEQQNGLSCVEADQRLKENGPNRIEKEKTQSWWLILLRQFNSPIVYLLLFAVTLSFFFKEWLDGSAILIVIAINTIIGFYIEYQANRSMEALQNLALIVSKVIRDGKLLEINSEHIVLGDLVYVEAGDIVPADGTITKLSRLQVNESALTGESVPVEKMLGEIPANDSINEQSKQLFKGTFITNGNSYYAVTATGMQTELGKIASLIQSAEQAATPLEEKLQLFSKKLIKITVVLVVLIFFVGWIAGHELLTMLNTAIALAVAAIPEGLPIVATLGLAKGMLKLAKHNVIVKKLSSVETLGATSVICTDKTGTLTENKMTVKEVIPSADTSKEIHSQILQACILCNTADVNEGKEIGDPLEIALLNYANTWYPLNEARSKYLKIDEDPFSSETKRMLTLYEHENTYYTFAKGAVESILEISAHSATFGKHLSQESKSKILKEAEALASSGYKVIGFANKKHGRPSIESSQLVFLGMIGLIDPPRKDVGQAIAECNAAGIKVVMITGDHPETAKEIARQLGMDVSNDVVQGSAMNHYDDLSEKEKTTWLSASIFARVTPTQKLDLIKLYQEKFFIVGMTGDGVNDAPALKKADIGIAMGLRGTQVAQDVADMVIKDDSFSSIVTAIKQGRIIFDNIRKFLIFLLSCNLSELFTIAVTAILNLHFQLFPLQILFINLITDVLPALALGMTPGNENIMKRQPKKSNEPLINNAQWKAVIFYSIIISGASLGAVVTSHYIFHEAEGWNPALCNNILFFTLIASQLLHVFNMSASSVNFFKSEIIKNKFIWYATILCIMILALIYEIPPVRNTLSINPLTLFDWIIVLTFSFSGLLINQLVRKLKIIKP